MEKASEKSSKITIYGMIFVASFFVHGANVILFFEDVVIDMPLTSFFLIIYDAAYILFLRRKENVSFLRAVSRALLYASWGLFLVTAHMFGEIYVNGVSEHIVFFGESGGETLYGFAAWTCEGAGFLRILFLYPSFIGIFYNIIYFIADKIIRDKIIKKKQFKEKMIWKTG